MLVEKTPKREALFWYKVLKQDGVDPCWLWTGAKNEKGYGWITVCRDGKQRFYFVHKVSYEWAHGEITDGSIVRHTCDTPLCVNPDHLVLGTHKDNMRDMVERGRHIGNREIDGATAVEIRHLRAGGMTAKDLAAKYNLTPQHVSNICVGVYWPNAGGPLTRRFELSDALIYSVLFDLKNLTQAAVAVKNGISLSSVQQIAQGRKLPKSPPTNEFEVKVLRDTRVPLDVVHDPELQVAY